MAGRASAKRYAQAIFLIAREKNELEEWLSELKIIAGLSEDPELVAFLENPKVDFNTVVRTIAERLQGISQQALNLVHILVANRRLNLIPKIISEYQHLVYEQRGIEPAIVTTAMPLDNQDKLALSEQLSTIVNKQVIVKYEVDPSLVGGVVAKLGGKILDGSTRTRLLELKRELAGETG